MNKKIQLAGLALLFTPTAFAQQTAIDSTTTTPIDTTATLKEQTLSNVTVTARAATVRTLAGAINGKDILRDELFKAACCNLGESFVNNPSVDVNYSDATTGAKQVKLLGLSGTYVQMLTENLPNFRGAALPYGLGYVPGNWMKSMQVSKGNSSVKNGYEAMTGQINVEYVKPEDETGMSVNLYGSTMGKFEANADGNIHINGNKNLRTELLAHFENNWSRHDGNGDGFQDDPQVRQYNLQNRWYWKTGNYMLHAGLSLLKEDRMSGQVSHHASLMPAMTTPYRINIATDRYEAYMKHALILNPEHGTNIALMGNVSMHKQDAQYGIKQYFVNEKNAYASLIFETNFTPEHNLSAGLSLNHDYLHQQLTLPTGYNPSDYGNLYPMTRGIESETTPGAYAQYTYNLNGKLIAMAGLRIDHSNIYGTFFTPRFHLKWVPASFLTMRLSAGKGYRSPHALAENNFLMASGRRLIIDNLKQEAAWNYGASLSFTFPINNKLLKLNTEYYYTHFISQTLVDYDTNPQELHITNLNGKSFSHTFQVDASYELFKGLDLTAAYRYNLVKATYNNRLMWKPLQSRYKALLTASYKTPLGLWQFDATLALNGGGRMPEPYTSPVTGNLSWERTYKAYGQVNAQITRHFRHFSVYVGGENLTNFKQKNPIIGYDNPWSNTFEPTMVYGPIQGAMAYVGLRLNLGKRLQ